RGVSFEDEVFPAFPGAMLLKPGINMIGRDPQVTTVTLPSVMVSRRHAQIECLPDKNVLLSDLGSFNGTFLNGERVHKPTLLQVGDSIDIGQFRLVFTGNSLAIQTTGTAVEIYLNQVGYEVTGPKHKISLLDKVSLVIRPREFVAIL